MVETDCGTEWHLSLTSKHPCIYINMRAHTEEAVCFMRALLWTNPCWITCYMTFKKCLIIFKWMSVCCWYDCCQSSEERVWSPRSLTTDSWKPPRGYWESSRRTLEEKAVFLSTELSFYPPSLSVNAFKMTPETPDHDYVLMNENIAFSFELIWPRLSLSLNFLPLSLCLPLSADRIIGLPMICLLCVSLWYPVVHSSVLNSGLFLWIYSAAQRT